MTYIFTCSLICILLFHCTYFSNELVSKLIGNLPRVKSNVSASKTSALNPTSLIRSSFPILGHSMSLDTQEINVLSTNWGYLDSDELYRIDNNSLLFIIDTHQIIGHEYYVNFSDTHTVNSIEKISIDTVKNVAFKYSLKFYPLFIINNSDSLTHVLLQDRSLIAILEGIDKNGKWVPLQFHVGSFCGNSYNHEPLPPHNFLLSLIPMFTGNYKTQLRLKIKNKDMILYSNTFQGSVSLGQFDDTKLNIQHYYSVTTDLVNPYKPTID